MAIFDHLIKYGQFILQLTRFTPSKKTGSPAGRITEQKIKMAARTASEDV